MTRALRHSGVRRSGVRAEGTGRCRGRVRLVVYGMTAGVVVVGWLMGSIDSGRTGTIRQLSPRISRRKRERERVLAVMGHNYLTCGSG